MMVWHWKMLEISVYWFWQYGCLCVCRFVQSSIAAWPTHATTDHTVQAEGFMDWQDCRGTMGNYWGLWSSGMFKNSAYQWSYLLQNISKCYCLSFQWKKHKTRLLVPVNLICTSQTGWWGILVWGEWFSMNFYRRHSLHYSDVSGTRQLAVPVKKKKKLSTG